MLTKEQVKAGRAILDWSQGELAQKADVSIEAVKSFERDESRSRPSTVESIREALEEGGIDFIRDGVRQRDDLLKRLEGDQPYIDMVENLTEDMEKGEEVLFFGADNSISPPEVIKQERRLIDNGAKLRYLVEEGDEYLVYPLECYRYIGSDYFENSVVVVCGDKIGMLLEDEKTSIVIRNVRLSNMLKNLFESTWHNGETPEKSTAPREKRYV